ncbi:MAG TPA: patatin-like phospholipase family protein [Phycisphaerae bacterium]|nr:patatin-like phospholipase family protein [Phycisphaerae bacterium]
MAVLLSVLQPGRAQVIRRLAEHCAERWMIERNREAVIAIQGGGVYALSLLGQSQAIFERGYVPLAFAGTSGGAILASLLWSGLSPQQIQAEFITMVDNDPRALLGLLSPFEPPPKPQFDYPGFLELQRRIMTAFASIPPAGQQADKGWLGKAAGALPGLWRAGKATFDAWGLWKLLQPHIRNRGLFKGDKLEEVVDGLIRTGLGDHPDMPPAKDPITFGHVARMMKSGSGFYRPPLVLTATNLSRRGLELINSVDPRYYDTPVAGAVRASAGFPVFFRPRAFGDQLNREWLVDGGVISNFPIWTFSDAFREQISGSEFYSAYAWRPWLRIGLRVVDDVAAPEDLSDPGRYLASLIGMLTGAARNELEDILARRDPRSIVIKQPTSKTEGPGVLAVGEVDSGKIRTMVELGHREAAAELDRRGSPAIYTANREISVIMADRLQSIVEECEQVVGVGCRFRANIFIPVKNTLAMLFTHNMQNDSDDGLVFPDLSTGVTGACYQLSTALVCNLAKVAMLRTRQPSAYRKLFNMTPELQDLVKKDRTWLMSVPIFDPYEVKVQTKPSPRQHPHIPRAALCDLGIALRGPLLGVLNLDAAWDYEQIGLDPDPDVHSGDSRIRAISAIMQAGALMIGAELTT